MCGTVCLDFSQEVIQRRIANKVFNECRAGVLSVQGFPQFDTLIKALKEGNVSREGRSFNVCVQQGEKLVVLQSFASKFTDADVTKDDAMKLITEHNEKFNSGGDFWQQEHRSIGLVKHANGQMESVVFRMVPLCVNIHIT